MGRSGGGEPGDAGPPRDVRRPSRRARDGGESSATSVLLWSRCNLVSPLVPTQRHMPCNSCASLLLVSMSPASESA